MPRKQDPDLLVLDDRLHGLGCPVMTGKWPDGDERLNAVETYPSTRPSGEPVLVRRCVVCGGHDVTSLGAVPDRAPEPIEEEA